MTSFDPSAPYVSGVLRRFGEDLHADPLAAYRSLVDRAHAACACRLATAPPGYRAAILIGTQTISGVPHVSICDNDEVLAADKVRTVYGALRTGRAGAVEQASASRRRRLHRRRGAGGSTGVAASRCRGAGGSTGVAVPAAADSELPPSAPRSARGRQRRS